MAFKGTQRIGTKGWTSEAPLLDALDEVFYSLQSARQEGPGAGSSREIQQLTEQFEKLKVWTSTQNCNMLMWCAANPDQLPAVQCSAILESG